MTDKMSPMVTAEEVLEMSGVETLHPGGLDLSRRVGEIVDLNPSLRILDVSSGKGVFACEYGKFGCKLTGIDFNQRFVEEARARALREGVADRVDFRVGDAKALPFRDCEFDVVINECAIGLTVIGDPTRVLNEMSRVAKPGGWIVIHHSTWTKDLPAEEREEAARRMGTMAFTVDELRQMLQDVGCTAVLVEDWSGVENIRKMRPEHKWNPDDPADFLSTWEKISLFPKIVAKYGLGALTDLRRTQELLTDYVKRGVLGYALIAARKS